MYYLLYSMINHDYAYFMIDVVFFCSSPLLTLGSICLARICTIVGPLPLGRTLISMMLIIEAFMPLLGR
mgnify:CR=1 FL=1